MLTKAPLTSVDNPAVKNLVKLRRHRERARQGVMLIDGARALRMALHNGFAVSAVFCSQAVATEQAELLRSARAAGASLQPVSPRVFGKIGYGERPDGILAVAPCPRAALADLPVVDTPLYLVAERLEKPGNLGAMLRSAVAAGADALVLCDGRTDLWNPNVVRASQGACFAVPVAVAAADETLSWLRRRAVRIVAAAPSASRSCYDVDLRGADRHRAGGGARRADRHVACGGGRAHPHAGSGGLPERGAGGHRFAVRGGAAAARQLFSPDELTKPRGTVLLAPPPVRRQFFEIVR